MEIRLGGERARHLHDVGDRLPFETSERGNAIKGLLRTLIGGCLCMFFSQLAFGSVLALWNAISEIGGLAAAFSGSGFSEVEDAAGLIPGTVWAATFAVIAVISAGVLFNGLGELVSKVDIRVTSEHVAGSRRGLTGTRSWREPLSAYRGLLGYSHQHSGSRGGTQKAVFCITLKHAEDPQRDVELWRSHSEHDQRPRLESLARQLSRPILLGPEDGPYTVREITDLDKLVSELVTEGKLEVRFDSNLPPPGRGLEVERTGGGFRFSCSFRRWIFVLPLVAFSAIGFGTAYEGFGPGGTDLIWELLIFGCMIGGFGTWMLVRVLIGRAVLEVTPEGVATWLEINGKASLARRIRATELEEARVGKTPVNRLGLILASDNRVMKFGEHSLDRQQLEYIRDAVLFTLARSRRPQSGPTPSR